MQHKIEKIYPIIDTNRDKWKDLLKIIKKELSHLITNDIQKADLFLVGGWDGYFMHTIKKYLSYKKPFFWINCWTVGFLLNHFNSWKIFKNQIPQISTIKQLTLKAIINKKDWEKLKVNAINDIVIWNSIFDYIKFKISLFDKDIHWTWLMITTSVGSTWYWRWIWWNYFPLTTHNLLWIWWIATGDFDKKIITRENFKIDVESRDDVKVAVDGKMYIIDNVENIEIQKKWEVYELWFTKLSEFEKRRIFIN